MWTLVHTNCPWLLHIQQVAQLVLLGLEIGAIRLIGRDLNRDLFDDSQSVTIPAQRLCAGLFVIRLISRTPKVDQRIWSANAIIA